MQKSKSRFENEVRLGLLMIIFLLFLLNFLSNFIIFRTRATKRSETSAQFRTIATAVSRQLSRGPVPQLSQDERAAVMQTNRLTSLDVVQKGPDDESIQTRRRWFASLARHLPASEVNAFAARLLSGDFDRLERGEGVEYFYVYSLGDRPGDGLLVLSRNVPDLAYLDDSQTRVVIISALSVLAIFGVYLILSRKIFAPFRKIKERALTAGRQVDEQTDDAEAVVQEYRRIIDELQEKEQQLIALNRAIQHKADSLEQFNDYLVQSMRSGLVTVNPEGGIVSINDAACEMLARDREDCIGRKYSEIFDPAGGLGDTIQALLIGQTSCEYAETTHATPAGEVVTLGVSTSPIYDSDHKPIGGAVLFHDLTEVSRLRNELETRNRLAALGEMAGGLAHQLRNSMGAIGGYLTLLKKHLLRRGMHDGAVEELTVETRQAENLIQRFLQFARPLHLDPESVSLRSFLEDIVAAFSVRKDLPGIEIRIDSAPDATVEIDPLLLKQALTNLVENAANAYGGAPGIVNLNAVVENDSAVVTVTDHGCGIDSDNLEKIFTPFFSSRPSGNGLGLPLAQKILDLHGGRLFVDSHPGLGTTFTLHLPLNAAHPSPVVS